MNLFLIIFNKKPSIALKSEIRITLHNSSLDTLWHFPSLLFTDLESYNSYFDLNKNVKEQTVV